MKHKRLVAEWVEKAEGDFRVMQRELRSRRDPCYDAVCYHAQQGAEKFLKARLTADGIAFAKTHSLTALLDQVLAVEPLWEVFRTDLSLVSALGVAVRYPGESAGKEEARESAARCRRFRDAARSALGVTR
jgi:HEPN domain-containing protein